MVGKWMISVSFRVKDYVTVSYGKSLVLKLKISEILAMLL